MAYATIEEVQAGFRAFDADEIARCSVLLEEASIVIDSIASEAAYDSKKLVSCRMVRRAIGNGCDAYMAPIGSTQGSASALGYAQSWALSNGSVGELYLSKIEKRLLGIGNRIGASSPVEGLVMPGD